MQLKFILYTSIYCLINYVNAENAQANKPEIPKIANPFVLLKVMPKVIEKLRESLPGMNMEVMLPSVLKEIQETIQLPDFSPLDPTAMPALVSTILERLLQRFLPQSQGLASTEQASINSETKTTENSSFKLKSQLPDLAFDRDPSRHIPREDMVDDDEKELGEEPLVKMFKDKLPLNLGEYDEFYNETDN